MKEARMDDVISRQAAIDALGEKPLGDTDWDLGCRNQWEWDTEILKTMPSAQPEHQWIIDALKEHLGESFEPITENEKEFKGWLKRMRWHVLECDKLARELEQAKASAQQWIPVTKRLPKAEEKVWVQTKSGRICFGMYEDGTMTENDSSWHWYDLDFDKWDDEEDCGIIPEGWWEYTEFHPDDEFDCPIDEKVVAWMPLPEPWEGENT